MHEQVDQLLSHLKAIWRHRWFAVVIAWIIALVGWTAAYLAPQRYEAEARVFVDTQSVLKPLLAGLAVQPDVDQVVSMMGRTLINRPNLEKVIRMADMDIALRTSEDRELLITRLSRRLTIQSAGRENLYTIAYTDTNPQEAKRVVQALLTIFVEGGLGDQRKDSEVARRFIDEQLNIYNDKLVAAEKAVTEFKQRHLGQMGGRDYYTRLVEAQTALSAATLELKEAENGRDAIKQMLAAGAAETPPSLLGDKDAGEGVNVELDARIQALEKNLDGLRLNYTEQHPDVVATLRIIAQLIEQKKAEAKLRKPSPSAVPAQDRVQEQLKVTLAAAEANVATMKTRMAEYGRRYDELKAAANAAPRIEAEYTQLTRDYEVTKRNYETLLARRDTAEISGAMDSKASVVDFQVIDPPRVPSVPKAPSRGLLMSLVLLAALGGGLGSAFLISQIRPTFSDERRLREVSGLQVLGTVVMAWTDAQKARRNWGRVALLTSFAGLLSTYAAIMVAFLLIVPRA